MALIVAGCVSLVGVAVSGGASEPTDMRFIQVAQGDRAGYVVERGRISVFDKSTLRVEDAVTPPTTETPVVLEVAGGPYLVYRNAGQIVRLGDPMATVPAGGPLSRPVATTDGTVWLHRADNGSVCELPRDTTRLSCPARLPRGHDGSVALVDDRPALLDITADTLRLVGKDGLGEETDIGVKLSATTQVANDAVDGRLAMVDPDRNQLHLIDTGGLERNRPAAKPISVDLPEDGPGRRRARGAWLRASGDRPAGQGRGARPAPDVPVCAAARAVPQRELPGRRR
jgi:hypothetical protein